MFFAARSEFCGGAPGQECDNEGVGVFVELPCIVDNASKFAVVVLWVVSNADPLGKKARVVWEVKCAGEETALS